MRPSNELQAVLDTLAQRTSLQPLSPKQVWNPSLVQQISSLTLPHSSHPATIALLTGLHLRNDSIDRAHAYAQQIEDDSTGMYWHAIIHRMEGDYSNAKYWFRMTGHHPAMTGLYERASLQLPSLISSSQLTPHVESSLQSIIRQPDIWDAVQFTSLVQQHQQGSTSNEAASVLEQLQLYEVASLFDYTLHHFLTI
ncbi:hypothetical protein ACFO9Q_14165 [Paenibacillus sp. GCM10023252]|uniref:hypothetical protein n=1 Tax=Paenibacillus sp. GCM10023252 TaxID=3252649 RepID=UPI0036173E4F